MMLIALLKFNDQYNDQFLVLLSWFI